MNSLKQIIVNEQNDIFFISCRKKIPKELLILIEVFENFSNELTSRESFN
jgi:hypothetical protein